VQAIDQGGRCAQGKEGLLLLAGNCLEQLSPPDLLDDEPLVLTIAEQHGDFLITHRIAGPRRGEGDENETATTVTFKKVGS
jgi:hypothetical protein